MHMHKTWKAQCFKKHPFAYTKRCKNGGFKNHERVGNLKKGEVTFETGGTDPPGNYVLAGVQPVVCLKK